MALRYAQQYNFKGKKALIRVDFNVPMDADRQVIDDARIQGAMPTIRKVLADGGAVVLMSHLGRPQQGYEEQYSLKHLLPCLQRALGSPVAFAPTCVGEDTAAQIQQLPLGKVLLLENVRFHAAEVAGEAAFAQALAAGTDVYVNDAFGTAHRAHASTAVVPRYFTDRLAGGLLQRELASADRVLKSPSRPFTAIVGGAKISDKILPLERLLNSVDRLLLGGGVANTFQQALGGTLGASLVEHDQVALARRLAVQAQQQGIELVLPQDVVIAKQVADSAATAVVPGGSVPDGWMALDMGPEARKEFATILQASATILWCGPIGVFEYPSFRQGTQAIAAAVAQATAQGAFSLIGGGDSGAAMQLLGYGDRVSHIATGGSALLAYLGGTPLPGVQALL
ncbi:MAG: phosphoglycerate kinase [Bacteroidota bacterium]